MNIATLLLFAAGALAQSGIGKYTEVGCYSSSNGLKSQGQDTSQSSSKCYSICSGQGYSVFATNNGLNCYCGDSIPSSQASSSDCSTKCAGYPFEMCGGPDSFSVYTVNGASVSSADPSSSTSSSTASSSTASSSHTSTSTSSSSASSTTSDSSSSTSTSTSTSSSSAESESSKPSSSSSSSPSASSTNSSHPKSKSSVSGGAIAGIVIGVLAALALIGGTILFLKKRRQSNYDSFDNGFQDPFGAREAKAAGSAGGAALGAVGPGSRGPSGGSGATAAPGNMDSNFMAIDQRMNPVMLGERRISDGSLADEQDYSRKILRVANPDDH